MKVYRLLISNLVKPVFQKDSIKSRSCNNTPLPSSHTEETEALSGPRAMEAAPGLCLSFWNMTRAGIPYLTSVTLNALQMGRKIKYPLGNTRGGGGKEVYFNHKRQNSSIGRSQSTSLGQAPSGPTSSHEGRLSQDRPSREGPTPGLLCWVLFGRIVLPWYLTLAANTAVKGVWTQLCVNYTHRFNPCIYKECVYVSVCVCLCPCVHLVASDSLQPHGLQPARLLCP